MKEAIANAGVFNLVIIFVVILLAFFIGSLSYSKAFKVKNKIIDEIEKDQGYDAVTQENIETWLSDIGYRVKDDSWDCPVTETGSGGVTAKNVSDSNKYQYCVYEFDTCSLNTDNAKCGKYYRVISYMYFDVPIISQLLKIPVYGETVTFMTLES